MALARQLSLLHSTAIVAGTIIGAGIFLTPNLVARHLPSPSWIILLWIFAGLLSLAGALAYAELGAMMPATGGHYVYLREIYGPLAAFLSGWAFLLVVVSGAIAWLAVSFALYLAQFIQMGTAATRLTAVSLIAALVAVNCAGLRAGARVQVVFTAIKLAALAALVLSAFLAPAHSQSATAPVTLSGFGAAMIVCLVTYDGWVSLSFVAGEVKQPSRTLPRALILGLAICIAVYVAANLAYLHLLTPAEMAASNRVAASAAELSIGHGGAGVVTLAILVSIIGAANGWILTAPRVYFAQAADGLFFSWLTAVHPRFQTPHRAILLQGAWATLLVLTGWYAELAAFAMFATWIFYALTVFGVILLRRRAPSRDRPYRVWAYPATPLAFTAIAIAFLVNTVLTDPVPSLACLAILAAGLPAYFDWRRQHSSQHSNG